MAYRIPPSNSEIASLLRELAFRLEMQDVPFKPQALEKAAYLVEALQDPAEKLLRLGGLEALEKLPGIGSGIARRMEEILTRGSLGELEEMRRKLPVDITRLRFVEGLGPKSIRKLYDGLGVKNLRDLGRMARQGRIRNLPGFGVKKEALILQSLAVLEKDPGRLPIEEALRIAQGIESRLSQAKGLLSLCLAGSLRRRKETIGDIDILAAADPPSAVLDRFASMPEVVRIHSKGPAKARVRLSAGLDADLRVVPPECYGAALLYLTGSKDHNLLLRQMAQAQGLKINEYGVYRGSRRIAGESEESVYAAVGLPWIPPELREARGEIEAAQAHHLPVLIEGTDLKGDLQVQTDWTDGRDSLEDMAEAARRLGREYIAITDHTRDLPMTRGSDEARLLRQIKAIRALNRRMQGIRILAGAELNIRMDGSLDIADEVLAQLDVAGAGIHSHFHLPREETTRRLIRAMENPRLDILFHPTARSIGRRAPIDVDTEALFAAAARTGTALEIDAQPGRLDLKDEHIRQAIQAGVKLVISSDAHSAAELRYPEEFGIGLARRGWATRRDILNALPLETLRRRLKRGKQIS